MSAAESVKNGSSLWEGMKVELNIAADGEGKFIEIVGCLFCFQVKAFDGFCIKNILKIIRN